MNPELIQDIVQNKIQNKKLMKKYDLSYYELQKIKRDYHLNLMKNNDKTIFYQET